MTKKQIKQRLSEIRKSIRAEDISYGEIVELQGLAEHIDSGDVELLECAGVPENVYTEGCKECKKNGFDNPRIYKEGLCNEHYDIKHADEGGEND